MGVSAIQGGGVGSAQVLEPIRRVDTNSQAASLVKQSAASISQDPVIPSGGNVERVAHLGANLDMMA